MRTFKSIMGWFFVALISWVSLEGVSFLAVYAFSKAPINEHLRWHVKDFHPIFRDTESTLPFFQRTDGKTPFTFHPRQAYFFKPGSFYASQLPIGPDGFICNATCERLERIKPKKEARVFVFGGSSVAGQGAESGAADGIRELISAIRQGMFHDLSEPKSFYGNWEVDYRGGFDDAYC